MPADPRVKVGVAAWLEQDLKVLLMRRGNGCTHGVGTWALPGGWIEYGELPEFTVMRECREELGVGVAVGRIEDIVANTWDPDIGHVICVIYNVMLINAKPRIMEPDKIDRLDWVPIRIMRDMDNLFAPLDTLMERRYR